MRFLDVINEKSIPQWSRCYYDYTTAKLIISLGKKARLIIRKIHDRQQMLNQMPADIPEEDLEQDKKLLDNKVDKIEQIMINANRFFFQYHQINKIVVFLFCQMKVHQLNSRLDSYQLWSPVVDSTQPVFLELLSNVFYEGKMLYTMCQLNFQAYKKIHKKHLKTFQNFQYFKLDSPPTQYSRILRTMDELNQYFDRLQTIYLIKKEVYPKKARDELHQQMQQNPTYVAIASYFFGLANGISISLVVVAVILFSINQITIDTNDKFKRDFPIWRGVSYVIMYMWILAINIVIFQKYKINYQLIMNMGKSGTASAYLLSHSSVFTFIFMATFLIYVMDISGIIQLGNGEVSPYLPLVVWGSLIGYLCIPLPIFNWQARWNFFKRIFETFISPIYGSPFYTMWIVEQLISTMQPFQDFFYTVCYYTTLDLTDTNPINECSYNLTVGQIFGIIIFSYRGLQCLRFSWKRGRILGTPQLFIAIRSVLNILILLVSYFSTNSQPMRIIWYVSIGPILLFSYYVDVKHDWGLLSGDTHHRFLRHSIGYHQYLYYVIILLNLLFRTAWVATLSPTILEGLNLQSFYFFYVIGSIQIIRRLFWNLLKMENQHINNVETFRIKTDYDEKQTQVRQQVSEQGGQGYNQDQLEILRRKQQLVNIKNFLDIKESIKDNVKSFLENAFEELNQIEKSIEFKKKQ